MSGDLFVALFGIGVTAAGWFVAHHLDRSREDRRRRLEKTVEYATRQIEEFYGPLFNLAHQMFLAYQVQDDILSARDEAGRERLGDEQKRAVRGFFEKEHFTDLHAEIIETLKHKLHLIRGAEMPQSFYDYLRHAIQDRDQRELWAQLGVDTSFLLGKEWPDAFYNDLKDGLDECMVDYETALGGLRSHRSHGEPDGGQ